MMEPRDDQQARVVERLRAADGAPVSFEELRAMGIESPALLGYELAAAGLPIEQAREQGRGALTLNPLGECPDGEDAPEHRPAPHTVPARPLAVRPLSAMRGASARVAAGTALAALLALTLSGQTAKSSRFTADHHRRGLRRSSEASAALPASGRTSPRSSEPTQPPGLTPGSPPIAVSPAAAASLEAAGHQLLADGRYAQAIGELREAVRASGGSVSRCVDPSSEACLTFAYALYDLGSALRMGGEPAAAVPVLDERLQINNQRPVVEEQLALARAGVA
jgi:hypothetical protein